MRSWLLVGSALCTIACAGPTARQAELPAGPTLPPGAEAMSLTGQLLYPVPLVGDALERAERNLADAKAAYDARPGSADAAIWLGRRTAYLGRYRDAIAIYAAAIARHPDDARLYRHRGHRYISTRQLDRAIADFDRAASLIAGKPDEIEPDGQPNARNIPTSTLQSNIWYHLALAHYLKGDFDRALPAWREGMSVSRNPDMQVATSHWLYMALRRLGREREASAVLAPIHRDMDVIENGSYHRLLLMYKGELHADSLLLRRNAAEQALDDVTVGYGAGNWHLYNGRRDEAMRIFREITASRQWAAFGYIAAEAELARWR
ncbi:MAG: hypothetical protein M3373_01475 [Gemmatimonadota bacterium]|nr:hypothetical protein [Gemmatimonadota bacterium]